MMGDNNINLLRCNAHDRDANIQFSKCLMILKYSQKNA